jgi:hypothetical protein
MPVSERILGRSKVGEMLVDVVLRRPEGAAIHQAQGNALGNGDPQKTQAL